MSGRRLGPASMHMLALLADAHGRGYPGLTRQAVLEHFRQAGRLGAATGRGETFDRSHTAWNLVYQGYIRRVNVDGRIGYALEPLGQQAVDLMPVADEQQASAKAKAAPPAVRQPHTRRPRERVQPPIATDSTHLSRAVRYGAGTVQVPIAPRSVFDLGNVFTVTEGATS